MCALIFVIISSMLKVYKTASDMNFVRNHHITGRKWHDWKHISNHTLDGVGRGDWQSIEESVIFFSFLCWAGKWNDEVCTKKRGFICKQASYISIPPTSSSTPPAGFCPAGYSPFGHKCLRVYGSGEGEQLLDWSRAWDFCSALGPGHTLASIGSIQENSE